MRQVYESILWWLAMWLPSPKKSFFAYVLFSNYHGKAHENFWDAIAIPRRSNAPWSQWEQYIEFLEDE